MAIQVSLAQSGSQWYEQRLYLPVELSFPQPVDLALPPGCIASFGLCVVHGLCVHRGLTPSRLVPLGDRVSERRGQVGEYGIGGFGE